MFSLWHKQGMNARPQHDQTTHQKLQIKHVIQRENRNLNFWTFYIETAIWFDWWRDAKHARAQRPRTRRPLEAKRVRIQLHLLVHQYIVHWTINQSIARSINRATQSIDQSISKPNNRSINRSINQSINRLINMLHKSKVAAERLSIDCYVSNVLVYV